MTPPGVAEDTANPLGKHPWYLIRRSIGSDLPALSDDPHDRARDHHDHDDRDHELGPRHQNLNDHGYGHGCGRETGWPTMPRQVPAPEHMSIAHDHACGISIPGEDHTGIRKGTYRRRIPVPASSTPVRTRRDLCRTSLPAIPPVASQGQRERSRRFEQGLIAQWQS